MALPNVRMMIFSFDCNRPDVIYSFLERGNDQRRGKGLHKELVHRQFYTKVCHRASLISARFIAVSDSWDKKVAVDQLKANQIAAEDKELTRRHEEQRVAQSGNTPSNDLWRWNLP